MEQWAWWQITPAERAWPVIIAQTVFNRYVGALASAIILTAIGVAVWRAPTARAAKFIGALLVSLGVGLALGTSYNAMSWPQCAGFYDGCGYGLHWWRFDPSNSRLVLDSIVYGYGGSFLIALGLIALGLGLWFTGRRQVRLVVAGLLVTLALGLSLKAATEAPAYAQCLGPGSFCR